MHPLRPEKSSVALYVHLPWCVAKCPYCDFNSHQLKSTRPDARYIDSLLLDLEAELPLIADRRIDTVFFGGGTPSLFAPEDFDRLLKGLRQRIAFTDSMEVTLEANPGTIERGRFSGYRQAGINRVSLGAQTFQPRTLERLGRIHSPEDTHRAVDELKDAGILNFNLDLMYALPDQTLEEAAADVETAIRLRPTHLSYYQLTLEPGTVFASRPPPLPDGDLSWAMQIEGQRLLAQAGYEQYEVSAFATHGFQCRHNLNYWQFGDYVGLGAGAHGKLTAELPKAILRTAKPKQPRVYQERIARLEPGERSYIAVAELPFEFMLNALRLNEGFTNRCYEARTGLPIDSFADVMGKCMSRGLVQPTDGGWKPTDLGRRFLNDLLTAFLP